MRPPKHVTYYYYLRYGDDNDDEWGLVSLEVRGLKANNVRQGVKRRDSTSCHERRKKKKIAGLKKRRCRLKNPGEVGGGRTAKIRTKKEGMAEVERDVSLQHLVDLHKDRLQKFGLGKNVGGRRMLKSRVRIASTEGKRVRG